MKFGDVQPGVAYKHTGGSMTPDEEFWDAYKAECVEYPGLIDVTDTLTDAARQRIMALPDFEGKVIGHFDSVETTEWLSLPRLRLPELIGKYIDHIELSPTSVVCGCEWVTHPDDVDMPPIKQRRKRGNEHPQCKVHTKLGFLLGFFAFTFPEESTNATDD